MQFLYTERKKHNGEQVGFFSTFLNAEIFYSSFHMQMTHSKEEHPRSHPITESSSKSWLSRQYSVFLLGLPEGW